MILALPPYSRAIASPAVQLAVMAQRAADELEKWRWIPVEERLPEPGKKVFAFWQRGIETYVDFAYRMDGSMGKQWLYQNWVVPPDIIAHWMDCPESPKEDDT